MYAVSPTGPVFVPGVAGDRLQAKTVERHVWTEAEEAAGMSGDVQLQVPGWD